MRNDTAQSTTALIAENRTFLMGISMIIIMIFHQYFVHGNILLNAISIYGNYGVDIFLFASGFGLAYSLQKNDTLTFYKRRLTRIIPACILIGSIKALITGFAPPSIAFLAVDAYTNLHYTWKTFLGLDLWFIRAILLLYLLAPLINSAFNRFNKLSVLISGFILGTLLTYFYPFHDGTIDWIAPRIPSFIFGMYIAKADFRQTKSSLITGGIALILAVTLKALVFKGILNCPTFVRCDMTYILFAISLPMICTFLIWLKKYLSAIKLTSSCNYIGSITLEIYLCHEFLYKCIYNFLCNNNLPQNWGDLQQLWEYPSCVQPRPTAP